MAAIDKYYCRSADEALALIKRFKEAGVVSIGTFLGYEYTFSPYDYLYVTEDEVGNIDWEEEYPLWNSPYYMDKWIYTNCKDFPSVIKDLRWKYNITDEMSEEEAANQFVNIRDDYKLGTKFKVLKKCPNFLNRNKDNIWWWMTVEVPNNDSDTTTNYTKRSFLSSGYNTWWYNEESNTFVPPGLPWNTSASYISARYMHEKKILRIIRNYRLPVGSIVRFSGRYVGQEWVVRVK